jgi:hypothetical protein
VSAAIRAANFAIRYWYVLDTYSSARRHGITDEDIAHVMQYALVAAEDEEGKVLYVGPDRAGNLVEVVSVIREDGSEIVVHAMPMRRMYETLLREMGDANG